MSLSAIVDALIASGGTLEQVAAVVRAYESSRVAEEKPKSSAASRQAAYRERKKAQTITSDVTRYECDVTRYESDADDVDVMPEVSPTITSDVTRYESDAKGALPPIPKEKSPLHPPKEITLSLPLSQNAFDQDLENLDGKDTQPRAREAGNWPTDAFARFWSVYPHKVGKGAAEKSFAKASRTAKASFDQVMSALRAYVASKPPDRSWCNPATWLNQERWDDQPALPTIVATTGNRRYEQPSGLNAALDRLEDCLDGRSDHVDREFRKPPGGEDFRF